MIAIKQYILSIIVSSVLISILDRLTNKNIQLNKLAPPAKWWQPTQNKRPKTSRGAFHIPVSEDTRGEAGLRCSS